MQKGVYDVVLFPSALRFRVTTEDVEEMVCARYTCKYILDYIRIDISMCIRILIYV